MQPWNLEVAKVYRFLQSLYCSIVLEDIVLEVVLEDTYDNLTAKMQINDFQKYEYPINSIDIYLIEIGT